MGLLKLTELHAIENTRVGASTIAIKNLDANEVDVLGNTESLTTNGTGDVGAVSVLISVLYFH